MDTCTLIFGKPLEELDYQVITNYFNTERFENDQLEFKSIPGTINHDSYSGIIRTLTAFLNSKGGVLVWGAPAGATIAGKKEKVFQGQLTPTNQSLIKDQLISKCVDSIVPLPVGIRAKILTNDAGGNVCVFEVNESSYSPHQTGGVYVMRIDGQTKPAPHHYVEALFRKITYPNIEAFIKFTTLQLLHHESELKFEIYFFNFSPLQNVELLSFRILCDLGVFVEALGDDPKCYRMDMHEYTRTPFRDIVHYGEFITDTASIKISNQLLHQNADITFILSFGAKNCPAKKSEYVINLANITFAPPELCVTSRVENQLYKESHDQRGITRKTILNEVLERNA